MQQLKPSAPHPSSTAPSPETAGSAPAESAAPVEPMVDASTWEQMRREQKLGKAAVAGAAAALISASIWAAVTVATEYQIGWMAVGVGALVGLVVRRAGNGVEPKFGLMAAALALVGCVGGNLLAAVGFFAKYAGVSFFAVLGGLDATIAADLLAETFAPMDVLFYAIAVFEAFKLSFQRVPRPG